MFFEEEIIKEEIAGIVNAFLMLKIRNEGTKVYDTISKNLPNVISIAMEKGFIEEEDALKIFGFVAY
ncbi:MAG: hypothetical protein QXP34_01075 [Candidatus Aenigmatarchaeota archaeon]